MKLREEAFVVEVGRKFGWSRKNLIAEGGAGLEWPGDGAAQAPPMWLCQSERELTGGELPHPAISATSDQLIRSSARCGEVDL